MAMVECGFYFLAAFKWANGSSPWVWYKGRRCSAFIAWTGCTAHLYWLHRLLRRFI